MPLSHLLEKNRQWSEALQQRDPEFFLRLSRQQSPQYLWIGCSDSRVPANDICGLLPGDLFVHRNIANVVVQTDLNVLSVIQFAVDVLGVKHIIVCGHYGCSGVRAAMRGDRIGLADIWLRHVEDVSQKHSEALSAIADEQERCDLLCELNVLEQVQHVSRTTVVRDAWDRGQALTVHSWIYGLKNGRVRDLRMSVQSERDASAQYALALETLLAPHRGTAE